MTLTIIFILPNLALSLKTARLLLTLMDVSFGSVNLLRIYGHI